MKVIFLDVDGVINSDVFLKNNPKEMIDRECVKHLKELVDTTDAVIVMSSGWRLWFDDNMLPENEESQYLYDILCEAGIKLYGKTPDFSTEEIRTKKTFSFVKAKEMLAWLDEHNDIKKFIAIDDLELMNDTINAHLVRTNPKVGLTKEDVNNAIAMLSY